MANKKQGRPIGVAKELIRYPDGRIGIKCEFNTEGKRFLKKARTLGVELDAILNYTILEK